VADSAAVYHALRAPRHETVQIRGLGCHLTRWGPAPAAGEVCTVLLHGWLDAGGSFQFMVDALARDRPLVAPDWRGFGRSQWSQESYNFPDYQGDLDALLDMLSPQAPVDLVGHSLGGNVAMLYAGLRPERVRRIVNLEGLGLTRTVPADAPRRLRKWLDQLKKPLLQKHYESFGQLADVINYRYPRFTPEQAAFVATVWGSENGAGRVTLAADPRHHWVNPVTYKREDAEAVWREIRAPLLILTGAESEYLPRLGADGTLEAIQAAFPNAEIRQIAACGHMLHIEQPRVVAGMLEAFLDAP
jgi:pimeloyl-ACP methyl ester carboxylesterase